MHQAIIAKIHKFTPIPNKNRIVAAVVNSGSDIANVIVSKDHTEGEVGIYFCSDLQLSQEYCAANDLVKRVDDKGNRLNNGYFDERRRVTTIKFGGVRSDGLWMPLSSLTFLYDSEADQYHHEFGFCVGDMFDTINGIEVCRKYFNPKTQQIRNNKTAIKQNIAPTFYKHVDTEQLIYYINDIPEGALITITEKLHGTSHRVGYVPVVKNLTWWQKLVNKVWRLFSTEQYELVHGTRNVIISEDKEGFHGSEQFRYDAVGYPQLPKDVILYGEIVGYANGKPIMPVHSTKDLKEVQKAFGDTITYDYGENNGARFYLYRVTVNGKDVSHDEVEKYAEEYGYDTVPFLEEYIYDGDKEKLLEKVKSHCEARDNMWSFSRLNTAHIKEGVVIRVDTPESTSFLKYKSFSFKVMEGITKMNDETVDMEEVA